MAWQGTLGASSIPTGFCALLGLGDESHIKIMRPFLNHDRILGVILYVTLIQACTTNPWEQPACTRNY